MTTEPARPFSLLASLLWRFSVRYWARHWIKLCLLVGIVALGSGSFLAIGLANRAATQSFDQFAQTVSGQSQVVVTSTFGKLQLEDLKAMRLALLGSEATLVPQWVASARLADDGIAEGVDGSFTLLGLDLLSVSNFLMREDASDNFWEGTSLEEESSGELPFRDGFYSHEEAARQLGWERSDAVPFFINDQRVLLPWAGPLPRIDQSMNASTRVLVVDWSRLAAVLDQPLQADRVDIVFTDPALRASAVKEAMQTLAAANPGNWIVESQQQRQQTGATMTLALRMNLRALSALSLLVAICLVFQAMDSAVARRQGEIATLRSVGVSSRTTGLLWLGDAALIGALGGALGLLLGSLMARVSTQMVSQTVNTLYHNTSAGEQVLFAPQEAALAATLTFVACLVAGWWPARQAARAPLIETMRQGNHRSSYSRRAYLWAMAAFAALAVVAYLLPPLPAANGHSIPVGGYALALFLIGFISCAVCLCLEFAGKLCPLWGQRYAALRLALSQFRLPVTRHRLALCGVTLSVGMTAAMVVLIGSFDATVRAWIGNTLQADLFIRSKASATMSDDATLSQSTLDALLADERVSDYGTFHSSQARIDGRLTQIVGFDTEYLQRIDHTTWLREPDDLLDLKDGSTAIVNETFASRFDASVGDFIELPMRENVARFRIIGIFADYGNENGTLGIDHRRFVELTGNPQPRGLALHLEDPAGADAFVRQIANQFPALQAMSNRWLREESLRIFNRAFSITYALEAIGLIISVAGLGTMLASLLVERRGETATLVRLGFAPRQIAWATLGEGLTLASLGIAAGLALGASLGLVLVYIINKQSFGWTLTLSFPWAALVGLSALTLAGAGAVSYLVGRWSAKQPIRNEE